MHSITAPGVVVVVMDEALHISQAGRDQIRPPVCTQWHAPARKAQISRSRLRLLLLWWSWMRRSISSRQEECMSCHVQATSEADQMTTLHLVLSW